MSKQTNAAHGVAVKVARGKCIPPMRRGELAERIGVTSATLRNIELGDVGLPLTRAVAIAECIATRSGRPAWQVMLDIAWPADGGAA